MKSDLDVLPPTGPPQPSQAAPRAESGFRPDIEGLRAIAVLLVLAYHAKVGPFTGGYIGVDVFYVLSGFLITSLLLRELEKTRRIRLPNFWARRARRLLPASFLVIAVTVIAGHYLLAPLAQIDLTHDAVAASTFVVNITFARRQSDYLTAQAAPSPLLHYWSLSLEEQFYLIWPLLLVLVTRFARHMKRAIGLLVGVLWPVSLVACIWLTDHNQPWAFFTLPARAWELMTGAVLALIAGKLRRVHPSIRTVVGWAGLIAIVAAAVAYSDTTLFPGVTAMVPVLGTAAVVAAGATLATGPAPILGWGPLQWIGRRSYAIYLWHWPALVLIGAYWGPLQPWQNVLVVLGSIVAAAISFAFLEDPVRHSRWLAAHARRGLTLGASLITAGVVISVAASNAVPALAGEGEAKTATVVIPTTVASSARPTVQAGTIGPSATATTAPPPSEVARRNTQALAAANANQLAQSLLTTVVPANLRPSVARAKADLPIIYFNGCHLDAVVTKPGTCVFGDTNGHMTVALFGDSHAAQWFSALNDIARRHRWRLIVLTKKGCPTAAIPVFSSMVNRELTECGPWRQNVFARLATEHPALVVMSSSRYKPFGSNANADQAWRTGLQATMDRLRPLAAQVLVLGDTPTPSRDVPNCLSSHLHDVTACNTARSAAVLTSRVQVEQDVAASHRSTFIATGDWLCTATNCPTVVGDVLVYRDDNHITATAAMWLMPYLEAATVPLVPASS